MKTRATLVVSSISTIKPASLLINKQSLKNNKTPCNVHGKRSRAICKYLQMVSWWKILIQGYSWSSRSPLRPYPLIKSTPAVIKFPKGSITHYITPGGKEGSTQKHTSQIYLEFGLFEWKHANIWENETQKHTSKKVLKRGTYSGVKNGLFWIRYRNLLETVQTETDS